MLKIDVRFIAGLGTDSGCTAVVAAILEIGRTLGLAVVAEGVETAAQARLLAQYGCQTAQGYLYSRAAAGGRPRLPPGRRRGRPAAPFRARDAGPAGAGLTDARPPAVLSATGGALGSAVRSPLRLRWESGSAFAPAPVPASAAPPRKQPGPAAAGKARSVRAFGHAVVTGGAGLPRLAPVRGLLARRHRGHLPGQLPHRPPDNVDQLRSRRRFPAGQVRRHRLPARARPGRPGAALRLPGLAGRLPAAADRDA